MFRSILIAFSILGLLFLALYWFRVKEYTTLEEALQKPEKVEFLNLSGKDLKTLPDELSTLNNLEILWLEKNPELNWEQACGILPRVPKLRALILSDCALDSLPACIANISGLNVLDLSGNPNLNWPQVFTLLARNPQLTALSLTNCNLTLLPGEALQATGIRKIFLMNNPISPENQLLLTRMLPHASLEFTIQ